MKISGQKNVNVASLVVFKFVLIEQFTGFPQADVGQEEDFEAAKEKAKKLGAKKVFLFYSFQEYIKDTQVKGLILIKCLNTNSKGIEYAFMRQEKLEQYQFMKGQIILVLFFISMVVGCII